MKHMLVGDHKSQRGIKQKKSQSAMKGKETIGTTAAERVTKGSGMIRQPPAKQPRHKEQQKRAKKIETLDAAKVGNEIGYMIYRYIYIYK